MYGRCWGIGRTFESYPTTPSKLAAALSIYKPFLPVFLQAIFALIFRFYYLYHRHTHYHTFQGLSSEYSITLVTIFRLIFTLIKRHQSFRFYDFFHPFHIRINADTKQCTCQCFPRTRIMESVIKFWLVHFSFHFV